jgi:hypothetical protein
LTANASSSEISIVVPFDGPQLNMHLMNPQPLEAASSEQPSPAATDGHRALLDRHLAVLSRIAEAARAGGREPGAIDLLAVSKTFDADAVLTLATQGQRRFAESYLQEALPKMAICHDRWATPPSGRSVAAIRRWRATLLPGSFMACK